MDYIIFKSNFNGTRRDVDTLNLDLETEMNFSSL